MGLHRRDRRRTDEQGAHADGAHDPRWRAPPAPDHGDPAQPLRQAGPPRRRRRPQRGRTRPRPWAFGPGYPAKKALANYRRLAGGGVQRAIQLLAEADSDLRGDTDLGVGVGDGSARRPAQPTRGSPLTLGVRSGSAARCRGARELVGGERADGPVLGNEVVERHTEHAAGGTGEDRRADGHDEAEQRRARHRARPRRCRRRSARRRPPSRRHR